MDELTFVTLTFRQLKFLNQRNTANTSVSQYRFSVHTFDNWASCTGITCVSLTFSMFSIHFVGYNVAHLSVFLGNFKVVFRAFYYSLDDN